MPRSLTPIELPADPTEDLHAATKAYVDANVGGPGGGGVGEILISDSHSTPLVFDDLLQTEAGDNLLYEDT